MTLARINAGSIVEAVGLNPHASSGRLLSWFVRGPAQRFAARLAAFDRRVGELGLPAGATWLLERSIGQLEVGGERHLPETGPALLVANHPGLTDTMALSAAIQRPDLRIVAADRAFLRALPAVSQRLFILGSEPGPRLTAIRALRAHLQTGGVVLTFPAGRIEPDPALHPERAARLDGWAERLETLGRLGGNVPIIPCVVSGVLSDRAQRHPLTFLRRRQDDRAWLGATLQLIDPRFQSVTVRVAFGAAIQPEPHHGKDLGEVIANGMRGLMRTPPEIWHRVLPRPHAASGRFTRPA